MTMEIEETPPVEPSKEEQIFTDLADNEKICFKSQQRDETDLTKTEKTDIARDIYSDNKLNFIIRFGKYLQKDQLVFLQEVTKNCDASYEINLLIKDLIELTREKGVKNRRYEALKEMIKENSYFSEVEMMKRNPLLYEQLVGQYLTAEEKAERDKTAMENQPTTLVNVLMEGIEREDAKERQKEQQNFEDEAMEEDEDEENSDDSDFELEDKAAQAGCSQWGEFHEDIRKQPIKKKRSIITFKEQRLLRDEFVTFMYENFLDGKDEDFDYDAVDCNEKYDSTETKEHDEEDKYFDSEEPETVDTTVEEESEDELDIFMSALNQNPAVKELSKDLKRLETN